MRRTCLIQQVIQASLFSYTAIKVICQRLITGNCRIWVSQSSMTEDNQSWLINWEIAVIFIYFLLGLSGNTEPLNKLFKLSHQYITYHGEIPRLLIFLYSIFLLPPSFRLGPCELPLSDQWLVHTQLTSSQQSQSQSSQSQSQYSSSSQTAATQQQQHSSSGGGSSSSSSSASHQHLQPKIMNAVVPAVSVPAASKKIRRKPDTKVRLF